MTSPKAIRGQHSRRPTNDGLMNGRIREPSTSLSSLSQSVTVLPNRAQSKSKLGQQ